MKCLTQQRGLLLSGSPWRVSCEKSCLPDPGKAFVFVVYGWVTNCLRTQIASPDFQGSGIWKQLSGVVVAQGVLELQPSEGGLDGGWRVGFQSPSGGSWRKTLVPSHVCLAVGLLTHGSWLFPKQVIQERRQVWSRHKPQATVSFITEYQKWHTVTSAVFCWRHRSALVQCERGRHKERMLGGHHWGFLRGWLPLPSCRFPEQCHRRSFIYLFIFALILD